MCTKQEHPTHHNNPTHYLMRDLLWTNSQVLLVHRRHPRLRELQPGRLHLIQTLVQVAVRQRFFLPELLNFRVRVDYSCFVVGFLVVVDWVSDVKLAGRGLYVATTHTSIAASL